MKDAHLKHAKGIEDATDKHVSMEECVNYVEKLLGDSPDKHAKQLKALKDTHAKHAGDVADM